MALTLRLSGETIVGVAPVNADGALTQSATGYCRRGVAELCVGRAPDDALDIVERSCSLAGATHRQALCLALESIAQVEAPESDRIARSLFAEIARILARLWTLGQTARAAAERAPWQEAQEQRERLFAALEDATGERAFWGVALPGGARADLTLTPIREALDRFGAAIETWRVATGPQGPLGRTTGGVGRITRRRAAEWGLTGVAACGAGLSEATDAGNPKGGKGVASPPADVRRSAPYDGYRDVAIDWPSSSKRTTASVKADVKADDDDGDGAAKTADGASANRSADTSGKRGDVADRMRCAVDDMALSLSVAQACLEALGDKPALGDALIPANQWRAGEGTATVEGPHGPVTVAVSLGAQGTITRLGLTTPGAGLLTALPATLVDRPLAQAPLILASLDLCLECLDL